MKYEYHLVREAICDVGMRMWLRQYVSSNDGNISVRVDGDKVLCTPTGISKGKLTPDCLPVVSLSGEVLSRGNLLPSSEIKMHLRIYQENPSAKAVVHAHPFWSTIMAIRGESLQPKMLPETFLTLRQVPIAPYATPSTAEVAHSVAALANKTNACFLEQHGALTWDKDLESAYLNMERLEFTARLHLAFDVLPGRRELEPEKISDLLELFGG